MLGSRIAVIVACVLLATSAVAQEGVRAEAEQSLRNAGITLEIPEDATEEQLATVIALLEGSSENASQLEPQIKEMLGME